MSESVIAFSQNEETRFLYLEDVIERGLQTFVDVGKALMEIRDSKLYRQSHGTFEDYCRGRWGFARRTAYRYIEAASVVDNVSHGSHSLPANERQARPLTKLPPEQQEHAWKRAVETAPNGQITGKHVARVVDEIIDTGKDSMAVHYSSEKGEWETPQAFFDLLDSEFDFELDVCALPSNAKCDKFFSPDMDGLSKEWSGICWMNPPYGDQITQWVEKAFLSAMSGATVVCLVPARTDTRWWWEYCIKGEIRFLKGRLKFGGGNSGAPFPSAVVVFRPEENGAVVWWERGSNV